MPNPRLLGIGRNQYIELMNKTRTKTKFAGFATSIFKVVLLVMVVVLVVMVMVVLVTVMVMVLVLVMVLVVMVMLG